MHADAARKPCMVVALAAAVGTCAGAAAAAFNDTRPPTALTTLRIMVSLRRAGKTRVGAGRETESPQGALRLRVVGSRAGQKPPHQRVECAEREKRPFSFSFPERHGRPEPSIEREQQCERARREHKANGYTFLH